MSQFAPGIQDSAFFRDDVPMTKQEVRAISLAKLQVLEGHRCLDIGSGSGSVTVEMALASGDGEVVAVDSDPVALRVLATNLERFHVAQRVRVVSEAAPGALAEIGCFDRIFIGGSGTALASIMEKLPALCRSSETRVVANAICLETVGELMTLVKKGPWRDFEILEVHLARGVAAGSKTRFVPHSPTWVMSFSSADNGGAAHESC
jgi:precorrin-6Y C5,15-methyltransferase (decarboxylating)